VNDSAQSVSVRSIVGFTDVRVAAERELAHHAVARPLPQRADWQRARGATGTALVVARAADGHPLRSVSASIGMSRALPGHHIYRVERFDASDAAEIDAALLGELVRVARDDARCLRLVVEVFERDRSARARLGASLRRLGFTRSRTTRMYRHTAGIALGRPTAKVLASLPKATRRELRGRATSHVAVCAVTDAALASRLAELAPTARSPFAERQRPWASVIALAAREPDVVRVAGVFDSRIEGPRALVAFAFGCAHGSYVTCEAIEPRSGALACAALWDLIRWANERASADWFDVGGVSVAELGDQDDSELKRRFARDVIEVGDEWFVEPHRVRATIARRVSSAAHWLDDRWSRDVDRARETLADATPAAHAPWSLFHMGGHTLALPADAVRDTTRR
jgi:hypothetical protein